MTLMFRTELPLIYVAIFLLLFLLFFAGMWWVITTLIGYASGWNRVASVHAATRPATGETFRGVSALMGMAFPSRAHFGSALTVVVAEGGFRLSIARLLRRPSTRDLFIPWSSVELVEEEKQTLSSCYHVTLAEFTTSIWIYGDAGEAIFRTWSEHRR